MVTVNEPRAHINIATQQTVTSYKQFSVYTYTNSKTTWLLL